MKNKETLEDIKPKDIQRIISSTDVQTASIEIVELFTKWLQKRGYNDEDMKSFGDWCRNGLLNTEYSFYRLDEHLEQWKQLTRNKVMKGILKKIDDKWFVEYSKVKYVGGNPKVLGSYSKKMQVKTLPLIPKNQEYMNCFLYVDNNTKVDFKEVLINPMGREVDPNNLGQNHSGCVWYAELIYDEDGVKDKQKQHLIDIMESDEELGLYDENSPFYNHQVRLVNDLAKKIKLEQELGLYDEPGVKEIKEIKLEDVSNDKKREKVKQVIHQHKVLKDLTLVNPSHLQMTSNGHGEFPDGYKLTEKGIQYIIEQLNKE